MAEELLDNRRPFASLTPHFPCHTGASPKSKHTEANSLRPEKRRLGHRPFVGIVVAKSRIKFQPISVRDHPSGENTYAKRTKAQVVQLFLLAYKHMSTSCHIFFMCNSGQKGISGIQE
ncbi:hypothetical protein V2J09_021426 [Rumex salicifolius]